MSNRFHRKIQNHAENVCVYPQTYVAQFPTCREISWSDQVVFVPPKETKWTTTTRSTLTHNRQKNVLIAWFARLSILYSVTSVWTTEKVHKRIGWFYLKRNKSTNIESTFHHFCDSKLFKWAIFDRKNPTLKRKFYVILQLFVKNQNRLDYICDRNGTNFVNVRKGYTYIICLQY